MNYHRKVEVGGWIALVLCALAIGCQSSGTAAPRPYRLDDAMDPDEEAAKKLGPVERQLLMAMTRGTEPVTIEGVTVGPLPEGVDVNLHSDVAISMSLGRWQHNDRIEFVNIHPSIRDDSRPVLGLSVGDTEVPSERSNDLEFPYKWGFSLSVNDKETAPKGFWMRAIGDDGTDSKDATRLWRVIVAMSGPRGVVVWRKGDDYVLPEKMSGYRRFTLMGPPGAGSDGSFKWVEPEGTK